MSSNLVINVRCTCEEEFLLLHKLHKLYQEDQLRKRLKDRLVSVQGNGDGTESITVKCEDKAKPETTLTDVLEAEALEDVERLEA
jgi:phage terminase small subunit